MNMAAVELILLLILSHLSISCVGDCLCGVSQGSGLQACEADIDKRIAGGEEAGVNEFPWAALLEIKAGGTPLRCGGTLVNDRLVYKRIIVDLC